MLFLENNLFLMDFNINKSFLSRHPVIEINKIYDEINSIPNKTKLVRLITKNCLKNSNGIVANNPAIKTRSIFFLRGTNDKLVFI